MKITYRRGFFRRPLTIEIPRDLDDEFRGIASGHVEYDSLVSSSREIILYLADLFLARSDARCFLGSREIPGSQIKLMWLHANRGKKKHVHAWSLIGELDGKKRFLVGWSNRG